MKRIAAILLAATAALSARPASAVDTLATELQPFAFLAGSCWRAAFPAPGQVTDTHCFTLVYGGHFLRDRHVVAGAPQPYAGETLYRWDPVARAIRYDYYSSDGDHSGGLARATADGIAFEEDIQGSGHDGAMHVRSSWTHEGEGYVALAEAMQGSGWRTLWRMHFTRVSAAPAD